MTYRICKIHFGTIQVLVAGCGTFLLPRSVSSAPVPNVKSPERSPEVLHAAVEKMKQTEWEDNQVQGDDLLPKNLKLLPSTEALITEAEKAAAPGKGFLRTQNVNWPSEAAFRQALKPAEYKSVIQTADKWWRLAIWGSFLPDDITNHVTLLPRQAHGDDWVVARYQIRGLKLQIIDGRSLTLTFVPVDHKRFRVPVLPAPTAVAIETGPGKPARQLAVEKYVASMFRTVTPYYRYVDDAFTEIELVDVKSSGTGYEGKLHIKGTCWAWFVRDVDWWSDGTKMTLNIFKLRPTSFSLIGVPDPEESINGLTAEDTRPFIRFSRENRPDYTVELAKYTGEIDQWRVQHTPNYSSIKDRPKGPYVMEAPHYPLGNPNWTPSERREMDRIVQEALNGPLPKPKPDH